MSNKASATILTAAGLLIFIGGNAAMAASRGSLSDLDKSYLKDTAQSNIEEIQFAPTVLKMAMRPESRAYGQHMYQDHSHAQKQLEALARRKHFSLPEDPSEDQKDVMKRLAREPRSKFDAAYKQEMIRDHTGDIAETRREISLGRDSDVRASAQKNLRLLQMHLKMARALP